jgi:beta-glucanase (GH16 family)
MFAVLISAIALASCGGGDGQQSIPATPTPVMTGVLLDAAVEGVSWDTTSNLSGITNTAGEFEYRVTDMVTFSIGDIILGTVSGADVITPVELTGSADPTVQAALNQLIFLQSIDVDVDPTNGITISADSRSAAFGESLDFNAADFETQVAVVVAAITDPDNPVVSSEDALNNFYLTYVEFDGTDTFNFLFPGFPPVGDEFVLVFSDEFNEGGVPNPEVWNLDLGYGPNNFGWGNNEWQLYTNSTDNVRVENGNLVITALCPVTPCGRRDGSITSAKLTTQDNFEFKFGKIIARIKVPVGQGTWPAFWALGANFPDIGWPRSGEIDFMEVFNNTYNTAEQSNVAERTTTSAMHWCDETIVTDPERDCFFYSGRIFVKGERTLPESLGNDFHIWEADWTANKVTVSIDGIEYFDLNINPATMEEFRRDFFLIMNVAIGGTLGSGGQPPQGDEMFPQTMLVDYVRVFQRPDTDPGDDNVIDFESLSPTDPSALANTGWLIFGSVFDEGGNFKFGYGAFPAPNNPSPPGWAAIVSDQGGPEQGVNQLSIFSDYQCCQGSNEGHFNGTDRVESNVFKEWIVGGNGGPFPSLGESLTVTFDAKRGNIEGATTAIAFIKTLDPNAGFSTTNLVTIDTTNLSDTWDSFMMTLDLTDPLLQGQLLQIGFATTASNFEGSGVFYDNIEVETTPAAP